METSRCHGMPWSNQRPLFEMEISFSSEFSTEFSAPRSSQQDPGGPLLYRPGVDAPVLMVIMIQKSHQSSRESVKFCETPTKCNDQVLSNSDVKSLPTMLNTN